MKLFKSLTVILAASLIAACASPLTAPQKVEYQSFEEKGLLIEEKNPSLGAGLGFLPGFGSFYGEEYGYGVVNLLLWPISIVWDPISGYNASIKINYEVTRASVEKMMHGEQSQLDERFALGEIDKVEYIRAKNEIKKKYMAGY